MYNKIKERALLFLDQLIICSSVAPFERKSQDNRATNLSQWLYWFSFLSSFLLVGSLLKIFPFENTINVFQTELDALQETSHICIRRIAGHVTPKPIILDPVTNSEPVPNDGTEPAKHESRGREGAGGKVDVIDLFVSWVLEDFRGFTRGLRKDT